MFKKIKEFIYYRFYPLPMAVGFLLGSGIAGTCQYFFSMGTLPTFLLGIIASLAIGSVLCLVLDWILSKVFAG